MKTNKKKPARRRFFSLKSRAGGELSHGKRLVVKAVLLPVALAVVAGGVFYCGYKTYCKLLDIRCSQAVVTDETEQIVIKASKHFSEANIRESFGLKKGCNLALIDFEEKRRQILKKRPLLSNVTITRMLPRKVTITVEERVPVARVNYRKNRGERESWLVVDSEGVVFDYSLNDSHMLPVIKEQHPSAEKGDKISGKALIGLRLAELAASKEMSNINLTEIDVSNETYLIADTRDYNRIKLLWSYITERGTHDLSVMRDALGKVRDIINEDLKTGHYQTFIVTGRNRVTVSDKEYNR